MRATSINSCNQGCLRFDSRSSRIDRSIRFIMAGDFLSYVCLGSKLNLGLSFGLSRSQLLGKPVLNTTHFLLILLRSIKFCRPCQAYQVFQNPFQRCFRRSTLLFTQPLLYSQFLKLRRMRSECFIKTLQPGCVLFTTLRTPTEVGNLKLANFHPFSVILSLYQAWFVLAHHPATLGLFQRFQ
jgi:hypothetical protein